MFRKVNPFLLVIIYLIIVNSIMLYEDTTLEIGTLRNDILTFQKENSTLRNVILEQKDMINKQKVDIKSYIKEIEELRTLRNVRVTAYAPLDNQSGICAEGDPTITSTGVLAKRGVIAVDPSKIPYGTLLDVPEYGEGVANDTGGALRNYDGIAIDVLVDTYEEAMAWGVRYLDVKIK